MNKKTCCFLLLCSLALAALPASGQGTAFTYQGVLNSNGAPANGFFDMSFDLYETNSGGTAVTPPFVATDVPVSNGLFIVQADFGDVWALTPDTFWLDISVSPSGVGSYIELTPRQQVTPTPYSIFSANAGIAGGVSPGTISESDLRTVISPSSGQVLQWTSLGLTWTNVPTGAGGGTNAWALTGNTGASPANGNFVGTTDNNPLALEVDSQQALLLVPSVANANVSGAPSVIGGSQANTATGVGATIGGGGAVVYYGLPNTGNSVSGDFGTVGGGLGNAADSVSTVGGGFFNSATNGLATVAGGDANGASGYASFVGGGENDHAIGDFSVVCGGTASQEATGTGSFIGGGGYDGTNGGGNFAAGPVSTIGGGLGNNASGYAATVGGGVQNNAAGYAATVAGGDICYALGPGATVGGGGYDGTAVLGNGATGGAATIAGGNGNNADAFYASIGGGQKNEIFAGYATIAGGSGNVMTAGGMYSFIGGGGENEVVGQYSTIGGGYGNSNIEYYATIGGGYENYANNDYTFVGGGYLNEALGLSSTVGGGWANMASGDYTVVGGGAFNTNNNNYATLGGGLSNTINSSATYVPGGYLNYANGRASFVCGQNAASFFSNSFVWGDGTAQAADHAANTFNLLATGGVYIYNSRGSGNHVYLDPGASSWASVSDRNEKKNFHEVDTVAVLDKLATIPVQKWNYKGESDDACPNIGPMAQDFKAAFYPGRDDKGITTMEFDGVELAAIQGLNKKLEERAGKLEERDRKFQEALQQKNAEIEQLQQSVAELRAMVQKLGSKAGPVEIAAGQDTVAQNPDKD